MGQEGFLFADWQLAGVSVPAWDFLTMIMTVDLKPGETKTLLDQYYVQLCKASAAAASTYSREMLQQDFEIGLSLWGGLMPVFLMIMVSPPNL